MAQTNTVNSEYKGTLAGEVFVQAFKQADTIKKNAITVLPNNIGRGYLPTLSYDADLQAYACGFDAEGELTYKDVEVILHKYKIDNEFCKDEFHQTFQAQASGLFGAANEIPTSIQDAILFAIIENLGAQVEKNIWQGDGLPSGHTGLIADLVADTGTIDVVGTAITSSNVVAEIEKVYAAIPDVILESPDLVISVAPNVARAYKQAQVNMGLNTTVGDKELDYLGIRMESLGGLTANTMVAYRVKNVGFLTGLESDLNEVRVIDHDATSGDGNIRTKVVLEMGVGYSFAEEIVLYKTA